MSLPVVREQERQPWHALWQMSLVNLEFLVEVNLLRLTVVNLWLDIAVRQPLKPINL